jgi:GAF domain-containing protein
VSGGEAVAVPEGEARMASRTSDRIVEEQAALRRVAMLVARAASAEEVFTAVTAEVGQLLEVDITVLVRYDPDDAITTVGTWTSRGAEAPTAVGTRLPVGGRNVTTLVVRTNRPARIDYADASGAGASGPIWTSATQVWGLRSSVGAPISVEGRLWGVIVVGSTSEAFLPADAAARLAGFAELVATAVANTQARVELRGFAEEQAALRRVATLVAGAAAPEEVLAAVAGEVGRLLEVDYTALMRSDPEDMITVVGTWTSTGVAAPSPVGSRFELGGRNVSTLVLRTGRPVRLDAYDDVSGTIGATGAREWGFRSSVGAPISVEGRPWGLILVAYTREEPLPADTEARLAGFTELVATAVANAQARVELRGFAEEQAALRRVATLVARAAPAEEVFAAVTAEVGQLLEVDITALVRSDPDDAITIAGTWTSTGGETATPVGSRLAVGGRNVTTLVVRTGRPARIDYAETGASGPIGIVATDEWGLRSSVGAPISVEGRLWGVIIVASTSEAFLPADTETRLAGFTELVGTALANTEAQAALTASRARIVAAADTARRRIERDLHDGAQQRLVSLALQLRSSTQTSPRPGADALATQMDDRGARRAARDRPRNPPGHPRRGRLAPGAEDDGPPLRRPRPPRPRRRPAVARTGRARRLLRHQRGPDQHRQACARDQHGRPGRRRRRAAADLRPRRRPRRRRPDPRYRPGRPHRPRRGPRRPAHAAQPARRGHHPAGGAAPHRPDAPEAPGHRPAGEHRQ